MEPVILHIETSSKSCSVALSAGEQSIASSISTEVNDHSATLVPMIHQALIAGNLKPTDLHAVAVSIGPGSYTGLRVGLSTAKAICYAIGRPLITVDTLQSLARTAKAGIPDGSHNIYVAVLDARRQDAYMAVFDSDGTRLEESRFLTVTSDCLDFIARTDRDLVICGEGTGKWSVFQGLPATYILDVECNALNLMASALEAFQRHEFADLASVIPQYLKPPNITIPS